MVEIAGKNFNDLVFLDETGVILEMLPIYLRAKKGTRARISRQKYKNKRYTLVAAISAKKIMAPMFIEDTIDAPAFEAYLEKVLLPELKPNHTLVMDNLSSHKTKRVKEILAKKNIESVYLPPYSPELNPIEMAWSKLKTYLRKRKAKTDDMLFKAVRAGLNKIKKSDCTNWINHMGYMSYVNC